MPTSRARPARISATRCAPRREAFPKWASMTAYNRGQVLYRVAEIMEGRRAQFVELTGDEAEVDAAIDSWVWYAGWADKLAQVLGSSNPVAGPYFNFTVPEPTGVVGVVAPEEPALAGFVARLAPVIVGGNAAVIVASQKRPLAAVTLAEVLATSDVPGGVVNVLTGRKDELCAGARRAHGRERGRPLRRGATSARSSSGSPPTTSSASSRTGTGSRRGTWRPSSSSRPFGTQSASSPLDSASRPWPFGSKSSPRPSTAPSSTRARACRRSRPCARRRASCTSRRSASCRSTSAPRPSICAART